MAAVECGSMADMLLRSLMAAVSGIVASYVIVVGSYLAWFMLWGAKHDAPAAPIILTAIPVAIGIGLLCGLAMFLWNARHKTDDDLG